MFDGFSETQVLASGHGLTAGDWARMSITECLPGHVYNEGRCLPDLRAGCKYESDHDINCRECELGYTQNNYAGRQFGDFLKVCLPHASDSGTKFSAAHIEATDFYIVHQVNVCYAQYRHALTYCKSSVSPTIGDPIILDV